MKRLGFLGAMNCDVVAEAGGAQIIATLGLDAEPLQETAIADDLARRGAGLLAERGAIAWLGGSAFNAARVAALLNHRDPQVQLAMFGIAAQSAGQAAHLDALCEWNVDVQGVQVSELPPATCLALVEPAGRTLLTASGANAGIARYLSEEVERLARLIAGCDLLHVTSWLDPETPGLVARLLAEARRHNPGLSVSLDPGTLWTATQGPGFDALLCQTDILSVNHEELAHLCGDDCGAASIGALGERLMPGGWTIVARTHLGAVIHRGGDGLALSTSRLDDTPLPPPHQVIDATGAGDTFSGGFLWHLLAREGQAIDAARLGFDLARIKIGMAGPLRPGAAFGAAMASECRVGTKIS